MDVDLNAFPLHRFLGPMKIKALIAADGGAKTVDEVRKGLVFLASTFGLECVEGQHGLVITGPTAGATPGVYARRNLTGWLLGLEAVVLLSLHNAPDGRDFRVLLEQISD